MSPLSVLPSLIVIILFPLASKTAAVISPLMVLPSLIVITFVPSASATAYPISEVTLSVFASAVIVVSAASTAFYTSSVTYSPFPRLPCISILPGSTLETSKLVTKPVYSCYCSFKLPSFARAASDAATIAVLIYSVFVPTLDNPSINSITRSVSTPASIIFYLNSSILVKLISPLIKLLEADIADSAAEMASSHFCFWTSAASIALSSKEL